MDTVAGGTLNVINVSGLQRLIYDEIGYYSMMVLLDRSSLPTTRLPMRCLRGSTLYFSRRHHENTFGANDFVEQKWFQSAQICVAFQIV